MRDNNQPPSIVDRYRTKYGRKCLVLCIPILLVIGFLLHFHLWSSLLSDSKYPFTPTFSTFQQCVNPIDFTNASAIFNTVNNVLSPKGSEINPVGVSFFPGVIRQGTFLYHGTSKLYSPIPESYEWIALDYEFSLNFIDRRRGRGGAGGPDGPGGPDHDHDDKKNQPPPPPPPPGRHGGPRHGGPPEEGGIPTLLTFTADRDLKVVLLDGSSAAKTTKTGEMDTQSILAGLSAEEAYDEWTHTETICKWATANGYDGIVRIEVSYEVIICDFSKGVSLANNVTIATTESLLSLPEDYGDENDEFGTLNSKISAFTSFGQIAAGARYDRDGDHRILLDYSGFQTVLNRTYVDPDTYLRRVNNISSGIRQDILRGLEAYPNRIGPHSGTDWKLVTREIVDKFHPLLSLLNATLSSISTNLFHAEDESVILADIENLLVFTTGFMKTFQGNNQLEQDPLGDAILSKAQFHYARPYAPISSDSELLIWSSILEVSKEIIKPIFTAFKLSKSLINQHFTSGETKPPIRLTTETSLQLVKLSNTVSELIDQLNWPVFYECEERCNAGQVCYTPSWGPSPLGGHPPFHKGGPEDDEEGPRFPGPPSFDDGFIQDPEEVGLYRDAQGKLRISKNLKCVDYKLIFDRNHRAS
ncbi:hypothetical protein WICPIJ_001323 [Wickerhamomyces pijperi]|uniref:Uncharacterized protein n=1 Tax=Wickerhamomyces pijperi TaxID=599730 RepID=A0A9P8QDW2_WICPI|nr:hypothetical protein WICPIJ_001323 [Wickerhamomyces pijperi]